MKNREIQLSHEESVLESFKAHLSAKRLEMSIIDMPDPPDAVVKISGIKTWIEITDAFHNDNWAKSITSYAAEDRDHEPYKKTGVVIEPDLLAYARVNSVILKKYHKKTMHSLLMTHGQGILLVGMYLPLTRPEELIELFGHKLLLEIAAELQIFNEIYLYENQNNGHRFAKLL